MKYAPPRRTIGELLPETSHWLRHLAPTVALGLLLQPGIAAANEALPYEIANAEREAGRTRALFERLALENVLYQLHLAGQNKQELHDTSAEIDRLLAILATGNSTYSVAPPPSDSISAQLRRIDEQWGLLRRIALASPYDYLRRADEFLPRRSAFGDPLRIQAFDRKANELVAETESLMALYNAECKKTDYPLCALSATAGLPTMLLERMLKLTVFVYAAIDEDKSAKALRKSRDAFQANHSAFRDSRLMRDATAPDTGKSGEFITHLYDTIDSDWRRMQLEIAPAIDGRTEELDIQATRKTQERLIEEIQRFTAALSRYAGRKPIN